MFPGDAAVKAAKAGPLELRNVCFSYPLRPDRAVLEDLTLTLPSGTVTALVGRSGAGKSTVAALLARFYEPHSGEVLLDGRPASSFTRGEWARAVSVVQQEPVLFGGNDSPGRWSHARKAIRQAMFVLLPAERTRGHVGTVADNISYGRYGRCTQEEIEIAAR